MKEKILAYVKDNRLFVSVIAVLMVIFCFFLWMTCGAGNSMEARMAMIAMTIKSSMRVKNVHFEFILYLLRLVFSSGL